MRKYKRYYIREWDINEIAFEIYSNTSIYVYCDTHNNYYISWNPTNDPTLIGSMKDIERYLLDL